MGDQDTNVDDDFDLDDEFLGIFHHSMDAKGRLVLPSEHRALIGEETIHMTLGFDNIMTIHPPRDWLRVRQSMGEAQRGDHNQRRMARAVFGHASKQSLDGQGRISITSKLRDSCEFVKEVVVVGVGDHIEVWPLERWEAEESAAVDSYVNTRESPGMGSL